VHGKGESREGEFEKINVDESGVFMEQPEEEEEASKDYYTIGIFSLTNLKHWLSPSNAQFELPEDDSALQESRKEA
jgi:hypothetical protein